MSPAQKLHREAMVIAHKAQEVLVDNKEKNPLYYQLTKDAFLQEKKAAECLQDKLDAEPTRSILYLGAAHLAFNCEEYEEAEKMIAQALTGRPPAEILEKLRELNRQVTIAVDIKSVPAPLKELLIKHSEIQATILHLTAAHQDLTASMVKEQSSVSKARKIKFFGGKAHLYKVENHHNRLPYDFQAVGEQLTLYEKLVGHMNSKMASIANTMAAIKVFK